MHQVRKGNFIHRLSPAQTEITKAELDPRNHIKIKKNFAKLYALSYEKGDSKL